MHNTKIICYFHIVVNLRWDIFLIDSSSEASALKSRHLEVWLNNPERESKTETKWLIIVQKDTYSYHWCTREVYASSGIALSSVSSWRRFSE